MVENLLDKYDNIYIIEKNVKIPSAAKPKNTKYPFYKMDVQDSFIVPKTESNCIGAHRLFTEKLTVKNS